MIKSLAIIVGIVALASLITIARGYYEPLAIWNSVTVNGEIEGRAFSALVAQSSGTLSSLQVTVDKSTGSVPKDSFSDLGSPLLQTLVIGAPEVWRKGLPDFYVQLRFFKAKMGRDTQTT